MLSYLHSFHAGNHADVIKHWLLLECVHYLQLKPAPFQYIDTHSGAGLYSTKSFEAKKTGEIEQGVLKIPQQDFPELEVLWDAVNDDLNQNHYPGSPLLVKRLLREGDKAWLYEMHPKVIGTLKDNCEQRRKCYVKQEDGFQGLLSVLPVKNARALVLVDPSYEIKSDYQHVVDVLSKAYQKMPQAMMLLWYPVVNRETINEMERRIQRSPMKNVQLFEVGVADDEQKGMGSSGMVIVNPPWTLAEKFKKTAEKLSLGLSEDGKSRWRFEQLVAE